MLVLSRKINEKIRIGSDVVINIISVSENQVKIGIEAPVHVKILRNELYENIKQQSQEATQSSKQAEIKAVNVKPVVELSSELKKETKLPKEIAQLKINTLKKDE